MFVHAILLYIIYIQTHPVCFDALHESRSSNSIEIMGPPFSFQISEAYRMQDYSSVALLQRYMN